MNTTDTSNKEVITKRFSPKYEITTSFEGDSFERRKLAELLANYIEKLKNGAVIAINGNWGEGKTWFGKHFEKFLNEDGRNHKTIYINAFEQDYLDDPFLVIAAEINSLVINTDTQEKLKDGAIKIARYIIPLGAKLTINTIGKLILGTSDLADIKSAISDGADDASKWIEKKFNEYENEKESFKSYKKILTAFCSEQKANGGQVVIFIDELDRCKPTFAVQLIERIKHLFDVPNLVFILLMNKNQLEKAIEGVYGAGTDSVQYLSKFINLTLNLPTAINHKDFSDKGKIYQFIQKELDSYDMEIYQTNGIAPINSFISELTVWANIEGMSLRDIEQACMLFVLANYRNIGTGLLTYFIVIKLRKPELFKSLRSNKIRGSELTDPAVNFLDSAIKKVLPIDKNFDQQKIAQEVAKEYLEALRSFHLIIENGTHTIKESDENYRISSNRFFGWYASHHEDYKIQSYYSRIYNLIDFPIDLQENTNKD